MGRIVLKPVQQIVLGRKDAGWMARVTAVNEDSMGRSVMKSVQRIVPGRKDAGWMAHVIPVTLAHGKISAMLSAEFVFMGVIRLPAFVSDVASIVPNIVTKAQGLVKVVNLDTGGNFVAKLAPEIVCPLAANHLVTVRYCVLNIVQEMVVNGARSRHLRM